MIFVAYKLPKIFHGAFKTLADSHSCDYTHVSTIDEFNKLDTEKLALVVALTNDATEEKSIYLKSGKHLPVAFIKVDNQNNFLLSGKPVTSENFCALINERISTSGGLTNSSLNSKVLKRLKLIHELTIMSLEQNSAKTIRSHILKTLTLYYKALSCSYLEYDRDKELFLISRSRPSGEIDEDINFRIPDKSVYEECVKCGDPIINCQNVPAEGPNYFCAPITENSKITGLIRLEYDSDLVDIPVDRTVLRITAGILSASRIREKAINALAESEERATTILDTTVDAIITIDEKGTVDSFNQAAERLFGYKSTEVIGKNVNTLMPSPYKEEHDEYLNRYHTTGERQIIGIGREVQGRRKNGTTFPMYLAVSEFRINNKRMYTGIVRDLTEERRLEKEVMRISEHERHRIGQDLHDGLGQMLSGINLLSKRVQHKLEKEEHEMSADMKEITDLLLEADQYSRGLARGLIKIDLDKGGFNAAIENLARQSERLFRITCTFNPAFEIQLGERTTAEHLYRIIQETINNAVKHGQATAITVSVAESSQFIRFRISDNGTGFPKNWRSQQGLGVRIMEFRARLIGASLDIANKPKKGAVITCTLYKT